MTRPGIILAAVITAMLGLPMWIDPIVEYLTGFALAYPANVWLVARGLKHGLMTERSKTEAPAPSEPNQHAMTETHGAGMPSHEKHSSHAAESQAGAKPEHASQYSAAGGWLKEFSQVSSPPV